jgi:hypothetical protein
MRGFDRCRFKMAPNPGRQIVHANGLRIYGQTRQAKARPCPRQELIPFRRGEVGHPSGTAEHRQQGIVARLLDWHRDFELMERIRSSRVAMTSSSDEYASR